MLLIFALKNLNSLNKFLNVWYTHQLTDAIYKWVRFSPVRRFYFVSFSWKICLFTKLSSWSTNNVRWFRKSNLFKNDQTSRIWLPVPNEINQNQERRNQSHQSPRWRFPPSASNKLSLSSKKSSLSAKGIFRRVGVV